MNMCNYYQAHVQPAQCWYFVAILRSFEHVCFDRTVDVGNSIFEFFVPEHMDQEFKEIMSVFEREGIVTSLSQQSNRLLLPDSNV